MSLVNDALKRATEAHNRRPPAPVANLPLRPVMPTQPPKTGIGLVLPATLLTIILAALISLVLAKRSGGETQAPQPVKSGLFEINAAAKSPPPPIDLPPVAPVVAVEPASVAAAPIPSVQPIPVPAPPVVAPLRLQAVFYTPPQPSAIISGKTVRVGDSLYGLQVVAIGSSSALLMGASQTNFLTLE